MDKVEEEEWRTTYQRDGCVVKMTESGERLAHNGAGAQAQIRGCYLVKLAASYERMGR